MVPGTKGKFGAPIFEPEVFRNVLYWNMYVWHCWYFLAPPQWFGARVIAPPCPFVTPLLIEPSCCVWKATDVYVIKQLAAVWQKCIKRARLAQIIMTYATIQLCSSSLHILYMDNAEQYWITARGATKLDGVRGKKQVWRPYVRTWGLPKANLLLH